MLAAHEAQWHSGSSIRLDPENLDSNPALNCSEAIFFHAALLHLVICMDDYLAIDICVQTVLCSHYGVSEIFPPRDVEMVFSWLDLPESKV